MFIPNDRTRKRVPKISTELRIQQIWESVGNDLRKSMSVIDAELKNVKD